MRMTDKRFEELLAEAITEYGGAYIDVPEKMKKSHRFTRSFEKRMQQLIAKERGIRPPRKRLSLRMLIVVIVTAVIAASSVMTVSAFREAIIGFITEVYEKFTNVQAEPDEDAPDTLEEIYEVTWVPEGFELVEDEILDVQHKMRFMNYNRFIAFTQFSVSDYSANYDTEKALVSPIKIADCDGFWIVDEETNVLVWESNTYVFEIVLSLDCPQQDRWLIAQNIAKSVKKAESA